MSLPSDRTSGQSTAENSPAGPPSSGASPPREALADPRWLLSALAGTLCLAALCVYGIFCLLFWQGQWQLVFHPSRDHAAAAGLNYQNLRFGPGETGVLQLDGWWIPADPGGRFADDTLLFLEDGSGSLAHSAAQLRALHALGINVFAFDYRGFGSSASIRPSERSVSWDADAAWRYLIGTRHLPPGTIAIYGVRIGAAVAAAAVSRHPQASALILEDPQPPVLHLLERNPRFKILPVRLLSHDRFDPEQALARLATPKLFLSAIQASQAAPSSTEDTPLFYRTAAGPKVSAVLASSSGASLYDSPSYQEVLSRFLGEHLPSDPQSLP